MQERHVFPIQGEKSFTYRSRERFDRVAFAMSALQHLQLPKMTVAVYERSLELHVVRGRDYTRGPGATWAIVGIPPDASREQIALTLAELAGVADAPFVVDLLLSRGRAAAD